MTRASTRLGSMARISTRPSRWYASPRTKAPPASLFRAAMSKRGSFSAVMPQRAFLHRPPACAIRQESGSATEFRDSRCARLAPDNGGANDESREPRALIGCGTAGLNRNRGALVRATRQRPLGTNDDIGHDVANDEGG